MRRFARYPTLLTLFILCAGLVTTARSPAAGVRHLTIAGAGGNVSATGGGARLTVGQSAVGVTVPYPGDPGAALGLWELLQIQDWVSGVEDPPPVLRDHLFANYPNPFNPSTTISYSLSAKTRVRLELYDLRGRRVDILLDEMRPAGSHTLNYEPRHLASGAYLVLMRAGAYRATQRLTLVK